MNDEYIREAGDNAAKALQVAVDDFHKAVTPLFTVWGENPDVMEPIQELLVPFPPEVVGLVFMATLDWGKVGNSEIMEASEKRYWLAVASVMGPDWIAKMKKVAVFMDRVESFR